MSKASRDVELVSLFKVDFIFVIVPICNTIDVLSVDLSFNNLPIILA